MNSLDIFVQQYFLQIRIGSLTEYMYLMTSLFDVSVQSVLICICIVTLIYIIKGRKFALLFGGAMFSQAVIIYLLKNFFDVSRPTGAVMDAFGKSFPSYHATAVTVFFVMLMYIFDNYFKNFGRVVFNTFCIIMVILVASSRLYLGVHWLSDVLAGVILGGIISYFAVLFFKKLK